MSAVAAIKAIDLLATGMMAALNAMNASRAVSDTIAARIADGGREWTAAERELVLAEMESAKAYAAGEIAKAADSEGRLL